MTSRILVTEQIAEEGINALKSKGYVVDEKLGLSTAELGSIIGDYDALIVRSATRVDKFLIDHATKLKVIGRAGVTVDNIDIEYANAKDIIVCNAPTSNIVSAAEHTFALMLSCARKIPQANSSMHKGKWERQNFKGVELYGKTLALFGLGRVGGMVAERASAFGMNVLAYDPYCNPERATTLGVKLLNSLPDILADADFVSVHLPLTPDTENMFGPEEFSLMKTGVIFINTSRPAIVDTQSLANFLAARKVRSAGIDVFDDEPCTTSPLHELDNAILTPHISALTDEAQIRSGIQIADYVWAGLEGSLVPTALTATANASEISRHIAPFLPAANMIGRMSTQIRSGVPAHLSVKMMGKLAELDPTALVTSVLEGVLSYKHAQCNTLKEAALFAERHGVHISTSKTDIAGEYQAGIEIDADGLKIASTIYGTDQMPRIISLLGYKIDVAPSRHSLVFEYDDVPGNCGKIGTILGNHGINISTMQIATNDDDTKALVYVNVGEEITDDIISEFKTSMTLDNLYCINL